LSQNSGVFPDAWKTAKVKPLYKNGDKHDMHSYRPTAVIPVFGTQLQTNSSNTGIWYTVTDQQQ
jgi:hypothetical protein